MTGQYRLSNVTKDYLNSFYYILEQMIKEMTSAELINSISHNFIVQMIPHHWAAIEMSHNILRYTTNISVQTMASQIITEQTVCINNMITIESHCNNFENSEEDLFSYQQTISQIMQTMFSDMKAAPVANRINCDFIWEMIPHHQGAITMSETTLQYEIYPELKPILYSIIASQKNGITQMQGLLQSMGS